MKKFKLKLSTEEVCGLDELFDVFLLTEDDEMPSTRRIGPKKSNALERCAFSLLKQWQLGKLKPRTYFHKGEDHKFQLEPPVAFAFVAFFERFPIQPTHYLGNKILQILAEIDQKYT